MAKAARTSFLGILAWCSTGCQLKAQAEGWSATRAEAEAVVSTLRSSQDRAQECTDCRLDSNCEPVYESIKRGQCLARFAGLCEQRKEDTESRKETVGRSPAEDGAMGEARPRCENGDPSGKRPSPAEHRARIRPWEGLAGAGRGPCPCQVGSTGPRQSAVGYGHSGGDTIDLWEETISGWENGSLADDTALQAVLARAMQSTPGQGQGSTSVAVATPPSRATPRTLWVKAPAAKALPQGNAAAGTRLLPFPPRPKMSNNAINTNASVQNKLELKKSQPARPGTQGRPPEGSGGSTASVPRRRYG